MMGKVANEIKREFNTARKEERLQVFLDCLKRTSRASRRNRGVVSRLQIRGTKLQDFLTKPRLALMANEISCMFAA